MSSRRVQSGFTLLEMIVAMALSALVSLIGAMALGAGADFYARSGLRQHNEADLRAFERTLRIEWEMRGTSVLLTAAMLEFETSTPVWARAAPGVTSVRYQCLEEGEGRYQLIRDVKPSDAQWSMPQTGASTGAESESGPGRTSAGEVMSTGLRQCRFAALGSGTRQGGKTEPTWVGTWSAKDVPPQLLRVELVGQPGAIPAMVFAARKP